MGGILAVEAKDLKIGYVDAATLLKSSPQSKQASAKLEADFGPRNQELQQLKDQAEKLEKDIAAKNLLLSSTERNAMESRLIEIKRRYQRGQREFREDYNFNRNKELAKLQQTISKVVIQYARKNKYDLVVDQAVYASKAVDITDKILAELK